MIPNAMSRSVIATPARSFDRNPTHSYPHSLRPRLPINCGLHSRLHQLPPRHPGWTPRLCPTPTPVRLPPPAAQGQQPAPPSFPLVPTSVVFYGAMTAAAVALGRTFDVGGQLTAPLRLAESMPYLGVMLGLLVVSTALAEVIPSFKELKALYQTTLIPQLKAVPLWGLAAMAAGAGIGEEALFRGLMQSWIASKAAEVSGTSPELALAAAVVITSIAFGGAHAVTASYFIFAAAAGAIFGIEYINCGLPAAAFTHGLYDFIAFVAVIQLWGGDSDSSGGGQGDGSSPEIKQ
jgi:membrane protease YdiL (CAAX protease family)